MNTAFKEKSSDSCEEYFTKLKDINITTVDSFQGEENKVILLSLVRSNNKDKIGFFAKKNRICVAISRAQCALYIFGNSSVYSSSQNWKKIINLLEEKRLVSGKFPFKEESDGIDAAKDEVCDTTKLSHRELTRLSLKIVGKYNEIAGLANLEKCKVENVNLDPFNYPEPKDKAKKVLIMISDQTNFSRKGLGNYLKEVGLHDLVDEVVQGTLRYNCPDDAGSPNETNES
ncbi:Hypothetical predicted protein [Paramuricea clavata]|uniref:DNA2/NAM7 helicase-like C-terminal domain-containing protein n=1 Tax=Paramuricea clavata TaxID=317549 RepID=A0A7D9L732_PARCT|nr:Hypothetical predicted protein [Paramuricea clavata]